MSDKDSVESEVDQKAKVDIVKNVESIKKLEFYLENPLEEHQIHDDWMGFQFTETDRRNCIRLMPEWKKLVQNVRKYGIYREEKITREFSKPIDYLGQLTPELEVGFFSRIFGKQLGKVLVERFDIMTQNYLPSSRTAITNLVVHPRLDIQDSEYEISLRPKNLENAKIEETGEPSVDNSYVTNFLIEIGKLTNVYKINKDNLVCKASELKEVFDLYYPDALKAGITQETKLYMKNVNESIRGLAWNQDLYKNHPVILQVSELAQKLSVELKRSP